MGRLIGLGFALLAFVASETGLWTEASLAADAPLTVIAAENFYGDIARQIGGDRIAVTSIISNPAQDPHLFETAPSTVRQVAKAQIVVFNGAGYDPWIEKLLQVMTNSQRVAINAAALTGKKSGDNPHLWYDPAAMPLVAKALADAFSKADPTHATDYSARLKVTLASLNRIAERVAQMKTKYTGTPVAATEPVFGLMTDAIGLSMRHQRFQMAMMNGTEPSARDLAAFEHDLKNRKVKALIYNKQVSEKLTERLRHIALKAKVSIVGVTETMPAQLSFEDWLLGELDELDKALGGTNS